MRTSNWRARVTLHAFALAIVVGGVVVSTTHASGRATGPVAAAVEPDPTTGPSDDQADVTTTVDDAAPAMQRSAPVAALRVRLTTYLESGVTYGGGRTVPGSAACSWNLPMGSLLRFPDGEQVFCNDRGLLGSTGWVDLWRRADLARKYGDYVTVEILRWGWTATS